jgi:molybdopterin-guanine dinucleotide biosynthesis protein A
MGGSKANVLLCGRPLLSYPLEALRAGLDEVVVLAKVDTDLPALSGVEVWIEPEPEYHPVLGIVSAVALAGGRPVVVCALDLPFVTPSLARRLADIGTVAVAAWRGEIQPLLGRYDPSVLGRLKPEGRVREAVLELRPRLVEVDRPDVLWNVNSPSDLLQAAAILERGR